MSEGSDSTEHRRSESSRASTRGARVPAGHSRGRTVVGACAGALLCSALAVVAIKGPFRAGDEASRDDERRAPLRSDPPLRIAVGLGFDAETIESDLRGVAAHLERELDVRVVVEAEASVEAARDRLLLSEVSLALLPALGCVQAVEWAEDARMLAAQSYGASSTIDALLVTSTGVGLERLEETRGRTICYVDRGSTSGYLAARVWLRSHAIAPDAHFGESRITGTHLGALRDLVAGRCELAAVSEVGMAAAAREGVSTDGISVLATTARIPGPCWVAAPRLDEGQGERLRDALLRYEASADVIASSSGSALQIGQLHAVDPTTYRAVRIAARLEGLLRKPALPPPEIDVQPGLSAAVSDAGLAQDAADDPTDAH